MPCVRWWGGGGQTCRQRVGEHVASPRAQRGNDETSARRALCIQTSPKTNGPLGSNVNVATPTKQAKRKKGPYRIARAAENRWRVLSEGKAACTPDPGPRTRHARQRPANDIAPAPKRSWRLTTPEPSAARKTSPPLTAPYPGRPADADEPTTRPAADAAAP